MKIKQLSLFLENKPGHLGAICRTLADADINILTCSLADTQQFGILRLIVPDTERAVEILEGQGFVVHVNDVVATEVEDQPGGVARVLEVLGGSDVNIEYMYAFTFHRNSRAILIFRMDDPDKAIAMLKDNQVNVLGPVDLFEA